jgi:hypothetical protein
MVNSRVSFKPQSDTLCCFPVDKQHHRSADSKEDWMPKKEKLPHRIDETVAQIAAILARGYVRYKNNKRFGSNTKGRANDVKQFEESEAFTKKPLDSSGHRSVHAFTS